ncbi:MAG: 3-oxoacyl-[acyl-carrier protein] reductase [Halioglobus sp.]|jgi:NAD(P)-dependent dehydrogenase (short-subunit alcohol dehydrogenase family)
MSEYTAVVTGGSTGIGLEICRQFLALGYTVVNLSRRPAPLEHDKLHNYTVDLGEREATRKIAADIAQRFAVDILVHNAGLIRADLIEDVKLEDLDYLAQVHLAADITLVQAFLPNMKANKFGRIINMSTRAVLGLETRTSYSATKAAMMAMTRTWALELGKHGITVNAVAPGPIAATEMFHNVFPEDDPKIQKIADSIPVKRVGTPGDVARATLFLAAPDNGFITGQTLFVCGGASLGSLSL